MHYIPKYSRDRQNKRRSQKFVTVLDKIDNLDGISLSKITNFVEESAGEPIETPRIWSTKITVKLKWILDIPFTTVTSTKPSNSGNSSSLSSSSFLIALIAST